LSKQTEVATALNSKIEDFVTIAVKNSRETWNYRLRENINIRKIWIKIDIRTEEKMFVIPVCILPESRKPSPLGRGRRAT